MYYVACIYVYYVCVCMDVCVCVCVFVCMYVRMYEVPVIHGNNEALSTV
jgi:hypothetical protein